MSQRGTKLEEYLLWKSKKRSVPNLAAHLSVFIPRGRYMHICDWYATFVHLVRTGTQARSYRLDIRVDAAFAGWR